MPKRATRQDAAIDNRRRAVAQLYLSGKTQAEIAEKFNVTQGTISNDLKAIRAAWLESSLIDFDEIKGRELARIDRLEDEYWQAWTRSRQDSVKTVTKQEFRDGQLSPDEARVEREGQVGDPRFLAGVQWCVEQRLRIFGIYDADKRANDWREWLIRQGYDPATIFEAMVNAAATSLEAGGRGGGTRRGSSAPGT